MRVLSSVSVAPTALGRFSAVFPGLTPGANLCRAYGGASRLPSISPLAGSHAEMALGLVTPRMQSVGPACARKKIRNVVQTGDIPDTLDRRDFYAEPSVGPATGGPSGRAGAGLCGRGL